MNFNLHKLLFKKTFNCKIISTKTKTLTSLNTTCHDCHLSFYWAVCFHRKFRVWFGIPRQCSYSVTPKERAIVLPDCYRQLTVEKWHKSENTKRKRTLLIQWEKEVKESDLKKKTVKKKRLDGHSLNGRRSDVGQNLWPLTAGTETNIVITRAPRPALVIKKGVCFSFIISVKSEWCQQ